MSVWFKPLRFAVALVTAAGTMAAIPAAATSNTSPPATVAKPLPTTPGTVITAQKLTVASIQGTVFRVEYWSKAWPADKPVKVSGLVIVPSGAAPAGGWPIVTWAHPTGGLTGNCAPSLNPASDVPFVNDLLARGWEVTASDYLNENAYAPKSKALLPYNVGVEEARNVIDIVRAARKMPTAGAGSQFVVWGWSEGGTTTVFADNIAADYAPELTLKGAAAIAAGAAPPQDFGAVLATPGWKYLLLDAAGFNSAYGNKAAPLGEVLTPLGIRLINTVVKTEPRCASSMFAALDRYKGSQAYKVTALPADWLKLAQANDAGELTAAGSAPLLLVQGTQDGTVPPSLSAMLASQMCALVPPQQLERWLYTGLGHGTVVGYSSGAHDANGDGGTVFTSSNTIVDMLTWISDRLAGGLWPDPYVPTGTGIAGITKPVTQTDTCG